MQIFKTGSIARVVWNLLETKVPALFHARYLKSLPSNLLFNESSY